MKPETYKVNLLPIEAFSHNSILACASDEECFERWKAQNCPPESEQVQLGVFLLSEPLYFLSVTKFEYNGVVYVSFSLWHLNGERFEPVNASYPFNDDDFHATVYASFDDIQKLDFDNFLKEITRMIYDMQNSINVIFARLHIPDYRG